MDDAIIALLGGALGLYLMYILLPIMFDSVFTWLREDLTPDLHVHKWERGVIVVEVEDKWDRDIGPIEVPHRVCKECGQKQYRTMATRHQGYDPNTWENYTGELKFKSR